MPKNQQNLILIFDIIVYNSGSIVETTEIRDQLKVRNGYVKTGEAYIQATSCDK